MKKLLGPFVFAIWTAIVVVIAGVMYVEHHLEADINPSVDEPSKADSMAVPPQAASFDTDVSVSVVNPELSIAAGSDTPVKPDFAEGEVITAWGDFVPMRVVNENCRDVQIPVLNQGGVEYVHSVECDRNTYIDHAYASLSNDALRVLSEQDGAAALILADRLNRTRAAQHREKNEAVRRLYVHALVLSGEQQAFDALFDYQGGAIVRDDGALDVNRAVNGWIWARIGQELGYRDEESVRHFDYPLKQAGVDLTLAREEVQKWLQHLDARRLNATGDPFDREN